MSYFKNIINILLIAILAFLFVTALRQRAKTDDAYKAIETINNNWTIEINKKDSTITTQEEVIIDAKGKLAEQADTIQGLKNQKQRIRIIVKTIIKTDTVKIPADQTITIDYQDYLKLPYSFAKDTEWYSYNGSITRDNLIFDSLAFRSEMNVVWGKEDHGTIKNLFKANKPIVSVIQKNPYSKTTEMNNYTFKDYNKKKLSVGFQVGYGMTNNGLSPYAGVGLGVNF
jgi:hypothetical protein